MRVGIVNFYFEHTVVFDQSKETHVFCFVEWKKVHPHSNWCGISASVYSDLFELNAACNFMPVQRIAARCAHAKMPLTFLLTLRQFSLLVPYQ